jgi:hypothetical protein
VSTDAPFQLVSSFVHFVTQLISTVGVSARDDEPGFWESYGYQLHELDEGSAALRGRPTKPRPTGDIGA